MRIFPALMTNRFWPIVLALGLLVSPVFGQPNEIRKSVARINNTMQETIAFGCPAWWFLVCV